MTQPTGVFVRLPLSDKEKLALWDKVGDDECNAALLAIGTPVVGGKLEDQKLDPETKTPFSDMAEIIINLQAALAAAQADSVERHEVKDSKALGEAVVAFKLMAGYSDLERVRAAVSPYFKALKGPEA